MDFTRLKQKVVRALRYNAHSDTGDFLDVMRGNDELAGLGLASIESNRQNAAYSTHRAIQAQLTNNSAVLEKISIDLARL